MSTNNTNANGGSDLTNIGVFWKKEKGGKRFLSGKIKLGSKEYTAFLFSNNKEKDNHPDYRLTIAELDDELVPPSEKEKKSAPKAKEAAKAAAPATQDIPEDDIPF